MILVPLNTDSLVACHECDALHQRQTLEDGQSAYCVRCGARLYGKPGNDLQRVLAFAISGLIFFYLMVSFPFLGISANGIERNVDLVASVGEMYQHKSPLVAVLVGMVLIVFPLAKVLGLIALVVPIVLQRRLPGYHLYCNIVERIVPWNMTEIYLVGVVVTFVKLSALANIVYGVAFWGFIGFVVSMTSATTILDFNSLWAQLDSQSKRLNSSA